MMREHLFSLNRFHRFCFIIGHSSAGRLCYRQKNIAPPVGIFKYGEDLSSDAEKAGFGPKISENVFVESKAGGETRRFFP
jgi:hypothetical protein